MEPEIPFQHGTQILCYIRHTGMQCGNQSCIKWQQIQSANKVEDKTDNLWTKMYLCVQI